MAHTTLRIATATREMLRELSRVERLPMKAVVQRAVEDYRRRRFLLAVNAGYATRQADAVSRTADEKEISAWDGTLLDGLPRDEIWTKSARAVRKRKRR